MKVFWSWQSDTPGKTGRHFVRSCLLAAINRIQVSDEVLEPTEREAVGAMHLDQDRQGVTGSPDLANLILEKIKASDVFVADVTPVSRIPAKRGSEDEQKPEKRNMNPNVAIELGYALSTVTSEAVLMILNLHYGKREHLPFDLAHKAGPLTYKLAPDAATDAIERERAKLTGQLVEALRPFIKRVSKVVATPHVPFPFSGSPAFYFDRAQPLITTTNWSGQTIEHRYDSDRAFYLRLLPLTQFPSFPKNVLVQNIQQANLCTLTRSPGGGSARPNQWGGVVFEDDHSQEGLLRRSTQVFQSGELWGISTEFINQRGDFMYIATGAVEQMFRYALPQYLDFASNKLGLGPTVRVVAGGSGLQGTKLAMASETGTHFQPLLGDSFQYSSDVQLNNSGACSDFLAAFFGEMWDLSGLARPKDRE